MKDLIIIKSQCKNYFFYQIYRDYPIFEMYSLRIKNNTFFKKFPKHSIILFGKWKYKLKKVKLIIIFDTMYSKRIGQYIKKVNPNCEIILFYWNVIRDRARLSYLKDKNIDRFYTFDRIDAESFKINYINQFYSRKVLLPKNVIEYDVFFIGRNKDRKNDILSLEKKLNNRGITTKFIIIDDEHDYINYSDYLNYLSKSKVILDYVSESQVGLSLRILEGLFFSKKVITNNLYIKNYDFYSSNNIFILGKDGGPSKIKKFLLGDYEVISDSIIDSYDFDNWIKKFKM